MNNKNTPKLFYDFKKLCDSFPELKNYVFINDYQNETIDFSNPKAVKALNKAILFANYKIDYWDFPNENLCPAIPSREVHIHALEELLKSSNLKKDIHILDIGTGATCIYPLIGNSLFQWGFIATDIDEDSIKNAQEIIDKNNLNKHIKLRTQSSSFNVFKNIIHDDDLFSASICNPPFYESKEEADKANLKKLKGLGLKTENTSRNFSGKSNELWVKGGELAFIRKYVNESYLFKNQCFWFTILVSKKENIRKTKVLLKKLNAFEVKAIPLKKGNKSTRIMAWTFLNENEQKNWN
ncbi:MAG: 23S rRNA (adenine(1618)-N(6))-methyltransferase RlmF [Flavobacteriaceae bacterium]|nr:23S rRNA (adenine(1618)-N(6))-methyltransferase RlmF [Flavobacteriaceae bacterium]